MNRVARDVIPFLILLLSACGDSIDRAATAVRDSIGIHIVESSRPSWGEGEGWTLDTVPVLDIGVVEGDPEYQLDDVTDAARLTDGRIVVANSGSGEIRYYDASGEYLRSVGGEGGGPGEFRRMSWIQILPEDSLLIYDGTAHRFTTFDPDGALVGLRSFTFRSESLAPQPDRRFPDGTFLVHLRRTSQHPEAVQGLHRDSVRFVRLSDDDSLINPVTLLRGTETFNWEGDGILIPVSLVFGHSYAAALSGDSVFAADNDSYEIGVYGADGTLERLIRRLVDPRPVTPNDVEAATERRESTMSSLDESVARIYRELFKDMPVPSVMPAFGDLMADAAGDLWVREYSAGSPDAPARWTIFNPEGRMLGDVLTPGRFRITRIGDDFVLGVWRDEFDVEHVRMYALRK